MRCIITPVTEMKVKMATIKASQTKCKRRPKVTGSTTSEGSKLGADIYKGWIGVYEKHKTKLANSSPEVKYNG